MAVSDKRLANCVKLKELPDMAYRWASGKNRSGYEVDCDIANAVRPVIQGAEPWPLIFTGDVGSGKTCAGLVLSDFYGGLFYTVAEWCERVQDAMFERLRTSNGFTIGRAEVWREWSEAPLVVLDELGIRREVSENQYEIIKRAIDLRENKPAVFISNLNPDSLESIYDYRVTSRMNAGTIIEFKGDRRIT